MRREDVLTLSQRDRDRLWLLHQVREGELSVSEAARRAQLGARHFRRLLRRFEAQGDGGVVHRGRGRRPNNAKPDGVRRRVLARAREEVFHDFGPTLLAEHLSQDPAIGPLHAHTLRRWLIEEGLWRVRARGRRHRRRRERRAAPGELVLMDTSIHAWLEGRSPEEIVLIAMIDDATSRLFCRFFPRDTGAANRTLIVEYLERFGRMGALYVDRASHFGNWRRPHGSKKANEPCDADMVHSIIRTGLESLETELIIALSPQAKGRVERLFGTLQDRLIKEMRVRAIASLQEANRFLEEVFIPFWNTRFTVVPLEPRDAHRPLPDNVDLLRLFAQTDERVIRHDFTFRFQNQHYQILKREAEPNMPGTTVTLEHRLDGTIRYRWRDSYLSPEPLPTAPARNTSRTVKPAPTPRTRAPKKPAPDHPWRQYPNRAGRGRYAPSSSVASAPAALRHSTSSMVEEALQPQP